jgi:tripartite-type tricarboxylate transporter receptor subunit TctC
MRVLKVLGLALGGLAVASAAMAQDWPTKPIHVVVPFSPGGAVDGVARIFAAKFQESMKVSVIVDNKPGAGGNLGADYVAKQAPDGYTILLNTNGQAISPATYKHLSWDPFRDFIPVTELIGTSMIFVASPKLPVKTLPEFIALAKSKPGVFNYASTGVGNALHLTMELIKLRTGMDIQMVPFRGDAEIVSALIGGDVQVALIPISSGKGQVESGSVRALAVTSPERLAGLEQVPTVAEQGLPGFSAGGWQSLFLPARTPRAIVDRFQQEGRKALAAPEVQKRLAGFSVTPVGSSPDEFAAVYKADVESFKEIVRAAKIPLQE